METILCPYCECRVMVRDVDDEGGMCPECGAVITGAAMLSLNDSFDDEDEDDDPREDELLDLDDEIDDEDEDF